MNNISRVVRSDVTTLEGNMSTLNAPETKGRGDWRDHADESWATLRTTVQRVATVLVDLRRETPLLDRDAESHDGDKLEQRVRARTQAGRELTRLEAAAIASKVTVERRLTTAPMTPRRVDKDVLPPTELWQELEVGWRRLTMAIEYARVEVRGAGLMTVLPGWRRGEVIVVPSSPPCAAPERARRVQDKGSTAPYSRRVLAASVAPVLGPPKEAV